MNKINKNYDDIVDVEEFMCEGADILIVANRKHCKVS